MLGGLTLAQPLPNFGSMQVHFTAEQEAQISQVATHHGVDAERLVKDAALRVMDEAVFDSVLLSARALLRPMKASCWRMMTSGDGLSSKNAFATHPLDRACASGFAGHPVEH